MAQYFQYSQLSGLWLGGGLARPRTAAAIHRQQRQQRGAGQHLTQEASSCGARCAAPASARSVSNRRSSECIACPVILRIQHHPGRLAEVLFHVPQTAAERVEYATSDLSVAANRIGAGSCDTCTASTRERPAACTGQRARRRWRHVKHQIQCRHLVRAFAALVHSTYSRPSPR